jgi:hypothetical protein
MTPTLPPGVTLTTDESFVLNTLLSLTSGTPLSSVLGYFPNTASKILTHLQALGLVITQTVQTYAGPTVEFYLAP